MWVKAISRDAAVFLGPIKTLFAWEIFFDSFKKILTLDKNPTHVQEQQCLHTCRVCSGCSSLSLHNNLICWYLTDWNLYAVSLCLSSCICLLSGAEITGIFSFLSHKKTENSIIFSSYWDEKSEIEKIATGNGKKVWLVFLKYCFHR